MRLSLNKNKKYKFSPVYSKYTHTQMIGKDNLNGKWYKSFFYFSLEYQLIIFLYFLYFLYIFNNIYCSSTPLSSSSSSSYNLLFSSLCSHYFHIFKENPDLAFHFFCRISIRQGKRNHIWIRKHCWLIESIVHIFSRLLCQFCVACGRKIINVHFIDV